MRVSLLTKCKNLLYCILSLYISKLKIKHMAKKPLIFPTACFTLLLLFSFSLKQGYEQIGNASYYAAKFEGRRTASGLIFRKDSMYCAHKTLKFGTILRVTNLKNDSSIIVKVVDRMGKTPHILDLSLAGAKRLNFIQAGVAKVRIEQIIAEVAKTDSLKVK